VSPVEKTGVASGVLNTMRELAASLGIAVTGAILTAREGSALAHGAGRTTAFVDGYQVGLYTFAAVLATGAIVAALRLHSRREPALPLLQQAP
jgi:hypothetical protein